MQIVARIAARLGLRARLHTATGPMTPEMEDIAKYEYAEIIQHKPGHNSVIIARARADADERHGWVHIPFGMESYEAMSHTRAEVPTLARLRGDVKRIVVCLGSGMTCCGILWGLADMVWGLPVLGVRIGADPAPRLRAYGPPRLAANLTVVTSKHGYATPIEARLPHDHSLLDPHYEAKCLEYLRPGDLFWVVGIRAGLEDN
jgi:hypothetical protein